MSEIRVSQTHKDRLFRFIFANPDHKDWTLSLYNAVNGSSYKNPDEIQMTTIEDVIYLSMKNDLSFLLADTMSLYEHQSTYNPNMPMRMFLYAGMVYSRYVEKHRDSINLNSSRQQSLPTPKLVCFYNGMADQPEKKTLKLSSAFSRAEESDVEVRVNMLNINYGRSRQLLEACKPLAEYSFFTELVRQYRKETEDMALAVEKAIRDLPEDSVIEPFLRANMAEVKKMCLTEYDEAYEREFLINENRREGWKEGRAEGRAEGLAEGHEKGLSEGREKGLSEGRALEAKRMDKLVSGLLKQNRIDDLKRATTDTGFKEKLFKEFCI